MNSLAYTPPKPDKADGVQPVSIVSDSDTDQKPQYPSLRLNGEQAKDAKLDKCAYGDEYEITVRIKAKRIGGSEYEMNKDDLPPVEFDVISADNPTEVESTEEDAGEKEEDTEKPVRKPNSRVVGPEEAGFPADGMD